MHDAHNTVGQLSSAQLTYSNIISKRKFISLFRLGERTYVVVHMPSADRKFSRCSAPTKYLLLFVFPWRSVPRTVASGWTQATMQQNYQSAKSMGIHFSFQVSFFSPIAVQLSDGGYRNCFYIVQYTWYCRTTHVDEIYICCSLHYCKAWSARRTSN